MTANAILLAIVIVAGLLAAFGVMAYGLNDLLRPDRRVRGGDKMIWAIVIIFGNLIGTLLYFAMGREQG
jgi:Phospholipase_D-nuclease N-terminal